MKKTLLFSFFALTLLASCDKELENSSTESFVTCDLVIPTDGVSEVTANNAIYSIKLNFNNSKATITSSTLELGGKTCSMQLTDVPFQANSLNGANLSMSAANAGEITTLSLPVTDLTLKTTQAFNLYPEVVPGVSGITSFYPLLMMNYKVGDKYVVKTFCSDNTFTGTTMTTYPSGDGQGTFQNEGIEYRVVMNVDKKKADVVLYNAKFAEASPEIKAMILKNLDVEYLPTGYAIQGTDLIPEVVEGSTTTPNPRFPFNSFSLTTTDSDMTSVRCQYTVATVFNGVFSGSVLMNR